jgi:hypothetical protein
MKRKNLFFVFAWACENKAKRIPFRLISLQSEKIFYAKPAHPTVHCVLYCTLYSLHVPKNTSTCQNSIHLQVLYCTLCSVQCHCVLYSLPVPEVTSTCQDSIHLQVLYCKLYTVYSQFMYILCTLRTVFSNCTCNCTVLCARTQSTSIDIISF